MKISTLAFVCVCLAVAGCRNRRGAEGDLGKYMSPECAAAAADGTVFVTAATGSKMLRLSEGGDVRSWQVRSAFKSGTPLNPTGVCVGGDYVYVTCGLEHGELHRYRQDGSFDGAVAVGHSPCAPSVSPDGSRVYLANRFAATVTEVDARDMRVVRRVRAVREPFGTAVGAEGKKLFVANLLPNCAGTNAIVSACVSVVDLADFSARHLPLPDGSTCVRGICASPDGGTVYVVHAISRYQLPTTQLERGWMNCAALSVFDGVTGEYVNSVLLDDIDLGAANPWGVAADDKYLVVSHAGTREVSVILRAELANRFAAAAEGRANELPDDFLALKGCRRRVTLEGDGPRGVCVCGGSSYVAMYFSEAVMRVDLASGESRRIGVARGPVVRIDSVRRGEILYNDATACFQHWQSCASCHPDGRVDALNWDLLNDGIGNPKQTKSELYSHLTAPTMAKGIRANAHACNNAGFTHIQFSPRPEEDVRCVDAYCSSLKPVPSPSLVDGRLSTRAERGRAIFEKAKCAECHFSPGESGPQLWTDCRKYDVGTGIGQERNQEFDTPTLCECWRTAPYLYDGRALTVEDVFIGANPNDAHGVTSSLTPDEISDLAEYVRSL